MVMLFSLKKSLFYKKHTKVKYVLDLPQNNSVNEGGGNGGIDETRSAKF